LRSDLDSVGELYSEDDFRQLVVTVEATPAFLGGLGELEDHGVQKEAQAGQRMTLDVLNSHQDLTAAGAGLIGAQRDRVIAAYTLLAAVGRLDMKTLGLNTPDDSRRSITTRFTMPGAGCARRQDNKESAHVLMAILSS
jgi:hypothetical protein